MERFLVAETAFSALNYWFGMKDVCSSKLNSFLREIWKPLHIPGEWCLKGCGTC